MNHGQIPGFIIYKAYTRKDIEKESLNVKETYSDYPIYLFDNTLTLNEILQNFDVKKLQNALIKNLIE